METAGSSSDYPQVEAFFQRALDLAPVHRCGFLERECPQRLRGEVETLLAHYEAASGSYLSSLLDGALPLQNDTQPPRRIGRYEIVREIARGGSGVVYRAQQERPRREVALKVLRFDSPSSQLLRRFHLEAEALGQLNHPGIAHIYEAGVAEATSAAGERQEIPFVAMELIDGPRLGDFAVERRLRIHDRLLLLAQVADALHHAHQKGIIHRDLKPANILVTQPVGKQEGETVGGDRASQPAHHSNSPRSHAAQPKIVDFGVARFAGVSGSDSLSHTRSGELLGTLAYMSPEQLTGDTRAIDIRSDIYSLGVVGYELLTGETPISVKSMTLPGAIRALAEADTPLASTRNRELAGDIDAILARAMEKSLERRYASAAEFAADIRRHLRGEPITARPASAWYSLQKAISRHRTEALLAGLLLCLLCGATVALLVLHWRAVRGWDAAAKQEKEAIAARDAEHTARDTAEAVGTFLHEMLAAARPDEQGKDASLIAVLESATKRLDAGGFQDQPAALAAVLTTIGSTWQALGDFARAEAHFQRALDVRRKLHGGAHADVAATLNQVGEARFLNGDSGGAERCFQETLAMRRELHGDENAGVAECYNNLAIVEQERGHFEQAEQHLREALRIWKATLGSADENIELCLHNLGGLLVERGRHAEAARLLREVYELRLKRHGREDHTLVTSTRNNLARCLDTAGFYSEAEPLHRQNLAIQRAKLPAGHVTTRSTILNLVECLRGQRRFADAETLLREEIGHSTLAEADQSPPLAGLFASLGVVLTDRDDAAQAEEILRWHVDYEIREHGEVHNSVAAAMNNLGDALLDKGDLDGAAAWIERALALNERANGTRNNASNATYRHHLAGVHVRRNECELAMRLYNDALEIRLAVLGKEHPLTQSTIDAMKRLGREAGQTP